MKQLFTSLIHDDDHDHDDSQYFFSALYNIYIQRRLAPQIVIILILYTVLISWVDNLFNYIPILFILQILYYSPLYMILNKNMTFLSLSIGC